MNTFVKQWQGAVSGSSGIDGVFPSTRLPLEVREELVSVIRYAKSKCIAKYSVCELLQIKVRRVERWAAREKETGDMSYYDPGPTHPVSAIIPTERSALLDYWEKRRPWTIPYRY